MKHRHSNRLISGGEQPGAQNSSRHAKLTLAPHELDRVTQVFAQYFASQDQQVQPLSTSTSPQNNNNSNNDNDSEYFNTLFNECAHILSRCIKSFSEVLRVKGAAPLTEFFKSGKYIDTNHTQEQQNHNPNISSISAAAVTTDSITPIYERTNNESHNESNTEQVFPYVYLLLKGKLIIEGTHISSMRVSSSTPSAVAAVTTSGVEFNENLPAALSSALPPASSVPPLQLSMLQHHPQQQQQRKSIYSVAGNSQPSSPKQASLSIFSHRRKSIITHGQQQITQSQLVSIEHQQTSQDQSKTPQQLDFVPEELKKVTSDMLSPSKQLISSQQTQIMQSQLQHQEPKQSSQLIWNVMSAAKKLKQNKPNSERICIMTGLSLSAEKLLTKHKQTYEITRVHTGTHHPQNNNSTNNSGLQKLTSMYVTAVHESSTPHSNHSHTIVVQFPQSAFDALMYGVDDTDSNIKEFKSVLERLSVFRLCTFRQINTLACISKRISLNRFMHLYEQSDLTFGFYYILSGEVKVIVKSNQISATPTPNTDHSTGVVPTATNGMSFRPSTATATTTGGKTRICGQEEVHELLKLPKKKRGEKEQNRLNEIYVLGEGSLLGLEEVVLNLNTRTASMQISSFNAEFLFIPLKHTQLFEYFDVSLKHELESAALHKINHRNSKSQSKNRNSNNNNNNTNELFHQKLTTTNNFILPTTTPTRAISPNLTTPSASAFSTTRGNSNPSTCIGISPSIYQQNQFLQQQEKSVQFPQNQQSQMNSTFSREGQSFIKLSYSQSNNQSRRQSLATPVPILLGGVCSAFPQSGTSSTTTATTSTTNRNFFQQKRKSVQFDGKPPMRSRASSALDNQKSGISTPSYSQYLANHQFNMKHIEQQQQNQAPQRPQTSDQLTLNRKQKGFLQSSQDSFEKMHSTATERFKSPRKTTSVAQSANNNSKHPVNSKQQFVFQQPKQKVQKPRPKSSAATGSSCSRPGEFACLSRSPSFSSSSQHSSESSPTASLRNTGTIFASDIVKSSSQKYRKLSESPSKQDDLSLVPAAAGISRSPSSQTHSKKSSLSRIASSSMPVSPNKLNHANRSSNKKSLESKVESQQYQSKKKQRKNEHTATNYGGDMLTKISSLNNEDTITIDGLIRGSPQKSPNNRHGGSSDDYYQELNMAQQLPVHRHKRRISEQIQQNMLFLQEVVNREKRDRSSCNSPNGGCANESLNSSQQFQPDRYIFPNEMFESIASEKIKLNYEATKRIEQEKENHGQSRMVGVEQINHYYTSSNLSSILLFEKYKKKKLKFFDRSRNINSYAEHQKPADQTPVRPLHVDNSAAVKQCKRKIKTSRKIANPQLDFRKPPPPPQLPQGNSTQPQSQQWIQQQSYQSPQFLLQKQENSEMSRSKYVEWNHVKTQHNHPTYSQNSFRNHSNLISNRNLSAETSGDHTQNINTQQQQQQQQQLLVSQQLND